jgi:hypothetical protein
MMSVEALAITAREQEELAYHERHRHTLLDATTVADTKRRLYCVQCGSTFEAGLMVCDLTPPPSPC